MHLVENIALSKQRFVEFNWFEFEGISFTNRSSSGEFADGHIWQNNWSIGKAQQGLEILYYVGALRDFSELLYLFNEEISNR